MVRKTKNPRPVCRACARVERIGPRVGRGNVVLDSCPSGLERPVRVSEDGTL